MRKGLILFTILLLFGKSSFAQTADTLQTTRFVTRATMLGVGFTDVFDTYLTPQAYKGIEFRCSRETMRMTKLFDGNVSLQNFFQANIAYTHNKVDNNNAFSGLVNWNIGLHYQFRVAPGLKLLAGGLADFNGGFIYNLHNSNNPASAKAYVNLDLSGMAIYHFKIKNYSMVARYQVNAPFMGVMFSPNYGQSYYEIFTLGNTSNIIKFTSFHNQPPLRQMLTLDFPVRYAKVRVGYIWDAQQSHVNGLKTHTYSHVFMIGFVKNLYLVRHKHGTPLPASVRAY